jgi:hypothetical protein
MRQSIRSPFRWIALAVGGVALAAVLAFLFGLVVMALWNWLMPGIFGIRPIAYWEAWGLVLLAHILFKAGRWDHGHRNHDGQRSEEWKERFRRRFKDRSSWSECRDSGDRGDGAAGPPQDREEPAQDPGKETV